MSIYSLIDKGVRASLQSLQNSLKALAYKDKAAASDIDITGGKAGQILGISGSSAAWVNPPTSTGGLTAVATDGSLKGNGTSSSPVGVSVSSVAGNILSAGSGGTAAVIAVDGKTVTGLGTSASPLKATASNPPVIDTTGLTITWTDAQGNQVVGYIATGAGS